MLCQFSKHKKIFKTPNYTCSKVHHIVSRAIHFFARSTRIDNVYHIVDSLNKNCIVKLIGERFQLTTEVSAILVDKIIFRTPGGVGSKTRCCSRPVNWLCKGRIIKRLVSPKLFSNKRKFERKCIPNTGCDWNCTINLEINCHPMNWNNYYRSTLKQNFNSRTLKIRTSTLL